MLNWYVRSIGCLFRSVPTYLVAHHLRKLGLTDDAEMQYPDLAEKVNAVRREALQTAAAWWVGPCLCRLHGGRW
jgi:hypothetical protein